MTGLLTDIDKIGAKRSRKMIQERHAKLELYGDGTGPSRIFSALNVNGLRHIFIILWLFPTIVE